MTSRRNNSLMVECAGTSSGRFGKTSPDATELRTTSPGAALTNNCCGSGSAISLREAAAGAGTAGCQAARGIRESMTSGALAT